MAQSDSFTSLLTQLTRSPVLLATLTTVYLLAGVTSYLYLEQTRTAKGLREEIHQQEIRIASLQQQRDVLTAFGRENKNIGVFRKLSFEERRPAADGDKLRAAQSLNSYARYVIDRGDFEKAKTILNESLQTYPTMEAQYYLGVVAYLSGDSEQAAAWWQKLSSSGPTPNDIFLYLSLAEYRSGNIEAARAFATRYASSSPR
jgi:tetratricopeptide (TPR) repeat protein